MLQLYEQCPCSDCDIPSGVDFTAGVDYRLTDNRCIECECIEPYGRDINVATCVSLLLVTRRSIWRIQASSATHQDALSYLYGFDIEEYITWRIAGLRMSIDIKTLEWTHKNRILLELFAFLALQSWGIQSFWRFILHYQYKPPKIQFVKIWDKFSYVNYLLYVQKFVNWTENIQST